jgi:hypothetical protein
LADSKRIDRAKSKALLASGIGAAGAAAGSPLGPVGAAVGGGLGVLAGLIVGDKQITFPVDYVAVPAHEYALLLQGYPSTHTIYIKAGETLMPTGGNVDDVELGVMEAEVETPAPRKRRKKNPWITFNKKFSYRAKRKNETSQEYLARRTKAARLAYNRSKKGGKN